MRVGVGGGGPFVFSRTAGLSIQVGTIECQSSLIQVSTGKEGGVGSDRILVVGAGIGGLVAALDLAVAGRDVLVLEQAAAPGGKMRQVAVGGKQIDAGPHGANHALGV